MFKENQQEKDLSQFSIGALTYFKAWIQSTDGDVARLYDLVLLVDVFY